MEETTTPHEEDASKKRHETTITNEEWIDYQTICKHPDISREPKNQTAFLIRAFIKKNADKITK